MSFLSPSRILNPKVSAVDHSTDAWGQRRSDLKVTLRAARRQGGEGDRQASGRQGLGGLHGESRHWSLRARFAMPGALADKNFRRIVRWSTRRSPATFRTSWTSDHRIVTCALPFCFLTITEFCLFAYRFFAPALVVSKCARTANIDMAYQGAYAPLSLCASADIGECCGWPEGVWRGTEEEGSSERGGHLRRRLCNARRPWPRGCAAEQL